MPSTSTTQNHVAAKQQQPITPELRQWIIAQAQAGFAAPSLLKSMTDSGWKEDVAIDALEVVLREHLNAVAVQNGLPPATPVPEPQLEESPLFVDVGDRQVAFELAGSLAREVLAVGCSLDLDGGALAVGTCTRTLFEKCEIVLWLRSIDAFHIEVARSLESYLVGHLRHAGRALIQMRA